MANPRITREQLETAGQRAVAKQPEEIHLAAAPDHAWRDSAALAAFVTPLRDLAFSDAGTFTVDPLPVALRFLLHASRKMYAVVYEHAKAGVWLDLVVLYEDGGILTVSTTRDRGLERRPGHPVVHLPNAKAGELYAAAANHPAGSPARTLSHGSLVAEFERAWREGTEWRRQRGISAIEAASVLLSSGGREARMLRADRIKFLGEQDGPPERELKARLLPILERFGAAGKAYLARVQYDEGASESVALCLSGTSATRAELVAAIRAVFASVFRHGVHLDILFIGPQQAALIDRVCTPFYGRGESEAR